MYSLFLMKISTNSCGTLLKKKKKKLGRDLHPLSFTKQMIVKTWE